MIGLITDFGTKDSYVGEMKGVIYSIHRQGIIVDIVFDDQNVRLSRFNHSPIPSI